jgi:hypothetical protein
VIEPALLRVAPWMKYLVLAAALAGCTSDGKSTAPAGSATTPKPATTPPVDPWAPGKVIPRPAGSPAWKLTIESHYGMCDPGDKRPCLRYGTATPDGTVKLVEHPNDGSAAVETVTTLSAAQRDRLAAIVSTKEFRDGMTKASRARAAIASPTRRSG